MLQFKKFTEGYLNTLSISILREIGREIGVRSATSMKKEELIEDILAIQKGELQPALPNKKGAPPKSKINLDEYKEESAIRTGEYDFSSKPSCVLKSPDAKDRSAKHVEGILEFHANGFGFLRANNYEMTSDDVYVSNQTIRRCRLKRGDLIGGIAKIIHEGETPALIDIITVNGTPVEEIGERVDFDQLTPCYPTEKISLSKENNNDVALRLIDIFAPIGLGQRGLIVAPPKTGKTTLLKMMAKSISENNKGVKLLVLLIDERPEEVTDIKRSVNDAEVVYSTFDQNNAHHVRVSELVVNRAKRMVENGQNVVILLDSITRLTRAYNSTIESTGKTLSGGLDPNALAGPKKFFGAARNIENGGSLTILATALVETGSRMDDVIYEEFKGTGNMEIFLSRELSEKRIFPAIELYKSGTRKEEMLLTEKELNASFRLRKILSERDDSTDSLIEMIKKTKTNEEFLAKLDLWFKLYEK